MSEWMTVDPSRIKRISRITPLDGTPRRIISCNVRGLPLVNGPGYYRRLRTYLERKQSGVDTMVFQEVFTQGVRDVILECLQDHFNIVWCTSLFVGNGLVIASRFKIQENIDAIEFTTTSGPDWFARKGALGVAIGKLVLITTHLQDADWDSSGRVRRTQLRALNASSPASGNTLIVGDFNTAPESTLLEEVTGARVIRSGHPTHGETMELDYALARGALNWACLAEPDAPPADHLAVLLCRHD